MSMKRVISPHVAEPQPETWSNCKVAGNFIQIAGCVSGYENDVIAGGDDVYEQAKITFTKIKNLVEEAGGVMDDIIKVTIFVTDITQRKVSASIVIQGITMAASRIDCSAVEITKN